MEIKTIPIEQINPAVYNPRLDLKPGDQEYEKIKRSIKEFDLVEPLVWNEINGTLIGGHQRLKVLKEMGVSEIQVSVVKIEDLQKEKALNIALNKVQGDWDYPKLKELLVDLDDGLFDISLTGFDENELKKLIDFDGLKGNTEDDDAPPLPDKGSIITQTGDLWAMGDHRLLCGDALKIQDVDRLMSKKQADMVFSDPPYNVAYEDDSAERTIEESRRLHKSTQRLGGIKNDKMTDGQFKSFLLAAFASYRTSIKGGGSLYICHPSSYQREFQDAIESNGFKVRCQIIWAKNTFAWGHGRYKFQHEPIFYAYIDGQTDPWYGDRSQSTLWQENKPSANKLHPTMKPVELILRALRNSSKAGDIVVDLFGGSGSTLIACEKIGRSAYLMEIDPAYCDVTVKRWENFTGKKAEKIDGKVEASR
jgi:DNA modification methylase